MISTNRSSHLPAMKLEGKVVLVTGAGRGIGKALALGFAHEGADVVVVSRSRDKLEVTAEEINKLGRKALALEADVSQEHDVRRIADEISRLGQRNRYESAWP